MAQSAYVQLDVHIADSASNSAGSGCMRSVRYVEMAESSIYSISKLYSTEMQTTERELSGVAAWLCRLVGMVGMPRPDRLW